MGDRELPGVQHQSLGTLLSILAPVEGVSHDRVPDGGQMYADLMSPTRQRAHLKQCGIVMALEHAELGDGRSTAAFPDGPALTILHIPAERSFDATLVLLHPSVHQRKIRFLDGAILELSNERVIGRVALGEEDDAAGLFVEAVDDAGPLGSSDTSQRAPMEQAQQEGAPAVPRAGIDDPSRGLIDHDEVLIFVEDGQRHRLRL
jgi:hypothetical protein